MSQQITGIPSGTQGADLVTAINDRIRRINLAIGAAATSTPAPAATVVPGGGGGGGSTSGGSLAPIEETLTADYAVSMPTATPGATQTVKLIQDGTGGHSVTWPSNVKLAPVINAASTPALTAAHIVSCLAQFTLCADGNWWLSNTPILGRHA